MYQDYGNFLKTLLMYGLQHFHILLGTALLEIHHIFLIGFQRLSPASIVTCIHMNEKYKQVIHFRIDTKGYTIKVCPIRT